MNTHSTVEPFQLSSDEYTSEVESEKTDQRSRPCKLSSRYTDSSEMGEDQKVLARALSQCALSRSSPELPKYTCAQASEVLGNGGQRFVKVASDNANDVSV